MTTYTMPQFVEELTRQALRLAADYGVCVSCKFSKYDSRSFNVAIVDGEGKMVSPTSVVAVNFSYGSTGKLLVRTDNSRRGALNCNSLLTAKIAVSRMFTRVLGENKAEC